MRDKVAAYNRNYPTASTWRAGAAAAPASARRRRHSSLTLFSSEKKHESWLEARHVHELAAIRSHHVAAYVEQMTRTHAAPTAKQHLAAIRMLFDWLIVGQVMSYKQATCGSAGSAAATAHRPEERALLVLTDAGGGDVGVEHLLELLSRL